MSKTKDRIMEGAIALFNLYGFSNVSMQRMADDLGLSPGNLTYHFPRKEDLMLSIYNLFQKEILFIIPNPEENKPDLVVFDNQIRAFYKLQQRFLFFYLDLLEIERSYEVIAQKHYAHINNQIDSLEAGLKYNQGLGNLKNNDDMKTLRFLAEQLWFTAVFWPRQIRVRGIDDNLTNLREALWQQIGPHLTSKGKNKVKLLLKMEQLDLQKLDHK